MIHNRISTAMESESLRLPQPPGPPLNPCAFMLVGAPPTSMQHWTIQQWIYQRAFEAAQAVARPSILDRDLLGVWN